MNTKYLVPKFNLAKVINNNGRNNQMARKMMGIFSFFELIKPLIIPIIASNRKINSKGENNCSGHGVPNMLSKRFVISIIFG